MKTRTLVCALLVSTLAFSGCLDITLRYIIHPDGSARLVSEVVLDSAGLQFMGSMEDMTASFGDHGSNKKSKTVKKSPLALSQSIADSIKRTMMKAEYAALAGKDFVKKVDVQAFPSDSNLRIVALIDLTSYRYLDSAAKLTGEINASSSSEENKPIDRNTDSDDTDVMDHHPLSVKLHHQDGPVIIEQGDSVEITGIIKDQSIADAFGQIPLPNGDTTQIFSDSAKQDLSGMFSGLLGQMKSRIIIEAPEILSHDPSGIYDPVRHTLTWDIDLASSAAGGTPPNRFVWFRKPGVGKQ